MPRDFSQKRTDCYAALNLPISAEAFIAQEKQEMATALTKCDRSLPKNKDVTITTKMGKPWISVAKLAPQPEPRNLTGLKAEVGRRWGQLFLLDVLKEAEHQTLLRENTRRYCAGSSELPQHAPAPDANEMGQPEVL